MYRFTKPIPLGFAMALVGIVFINGCVRVSPRPETGVVPTGTIQPSYPSPLPSGPLSTYHTVRPGETLSKIAQMYGIQDYQILAGWNNIPYPYRVNPGDQLRVSAPWNGLSPSISYPVNPYGSPVSPTPKKSYKKISPSMGSTKKKTPPPTTKTSEHIVQAGDTLYNIAQRYGQDVATIARWNNLQPPYTLRSNQRLLVKASGKSSKTVAKENQWVQQKSSSSTSTTKMSGDNDKPTYHSVAAGENLYRISKLYGHSVEEIMAWNGLTTPYNLKVGQSLKVSSAATATSQKKITSYPTGGTPQKSRIPKDVIVHVVKKEDTVYSIAAQYGIKVFDLAIWNGIGEPYTIFPGQKLKIVK